MPQPRQPYRSVKLNIPGGRPMGRPRPRRQASGWSRRATTAGEIVGLTTQPHKRTWNRRPGITRTCSESRNAGTVRIRRAGPRQVTHDRRTRSIGGSPLAGNPLEEVGAVSQRATVGHRPGGLQRERRRLELLHPRPGPVPRLPVGRGRHRRRLRRQTAALLRACLVERQGPHPQGTPLRPDQ